MSGIGTVAAWSLAAVLVTAAAVKGWTREATVDAFRRLRVPGPRLAAIVVPLTEAATALLLLGRPALGGLAALVLLGGFSVFVAVRALQGHTASCGCFGGSSRGSHPAVTLTRNALLGALAVTALASPAAVTPMLPDVVAASAAIVTGVVVVGLVDLHVRTGRVWDNRLEPGPGGKP